MSHEIIVISNADGSLEPGAVQDYLPAARVITSNQRFGMAILRNMGIQEARGRYIQLLDVDSIVTPNAMDSLVALMDAHPDTGVAGPKVVSADGGLQYTCRRFLTPRVLLLKRTMMGRLKPFRSDVRDYLMKNWPHDRSQEADWVCGGHSIVRREAMEEIGFLDKRYSFGFEDINLCYRARRAGWQVHYVPESVFIHHGNPSWHNGINRMTMEMAKSLLYFYWKTDLMPAGFLPGAGRDTHLRPSLMR